jgi:hypothetical protein
MANFVLQESIKNNLIGDFSLRQQYYQTMQSLADAIQEIISGTGATIPQQELDDISDDFKNHIVEHHVAYLTTMVNQEFWTSEDMTSVNSAITSGNSYIS